MGADLKLLYPVRKRCATCRSYFGFEVLDGLWCSRSCAGLPPMSSDQKDWPREHHTLNFRGSRLIIKEKRNWLTMELAQIKADHWGKQAYQCSYCRGYHIGTPNPNLPQPT